MTERIKQTRGKINIRERAEEETETEKDPAREVKGRKKLVSHSVRTNEIDARIKWTE